jgi:predicted transcriptional regulator
MTARKNNDGRGGAGGHERREVVEARAERAWALLAAGYSQEDIANQLNVSQSAVCKILQREDARRAGERVDEDAYRARLEAQLDHIFREALRAYERSQHDQTRKRQRQITDGEGNDAGTVLEADVLSRDGDPRFLDQAGRALEQKARLLGLHKRTGRARPGAGEDPGVARDRLARGLDRLLRGSGPVSRKPE